MRKGYPFFLFLPLIPRPGNNKVRISVIKRIIDFYEMRAVKFNIAYILM